MTKNTLHMLSITSLLLGAAACTDDIEASDTRADTGSETGDGDGDPDTGDGDGDPDTGDGDGDPDTGDGDGDPGGECGDGVLDNGEQCDDGNNLDTDACTNACTLAFCGDGVVEDGVEECDDANTDNTDTCVEGCVAQQCGDGYVGPGEGCDDGNTVDDDECSNTCALASCGDGMLALGEECDDGNDDNTDDCLSTCVAATCGDGHLWADNEACDDANLDNTDDCVDGCAVASCGDGHVWAGNEECDDANMDNTDACTLECVLAACDDAMMNGSEWGIDCGGDCGGCDELFSADEDTLAILELNGDANDSSGNERHAMLIGGSYVDTAWGQGLSLPQMTQQGLSWTAHVADLVAPYTIELVLTPAQTTCFQRLYTFNSMSDHGWYYCSGFASYPNGTIGQQFPVNQRQYLALVSTDDTTLDVYVDGVLLGSTPTGFTTPSGHAEFFNDDADNLHFEELLGVVEAIRISSVARTEQEFIDIQARIELQP
ncbi:hypothetical protein ENSA7_54970 [Enhygromyxa salina]|uniref:Multiple EGF-like-domain protein 3 n=2 Tax=Enhygromyxa salina TaxID=215803 RepID=A0A2S9YC13_9BACT|nr:hypothetical protein ENSA7_54970 [Enhygromyxa salina]